MKLVHKLSWFLIGCLFFCLVKPTQAAFDFSTPDQIQIWPELRFNNPTGVAVDSQGNIYVVDRDNGKIMKYDGNSWSQLGNTTDLHTLSTIAIDQEDNIYISDWNSDSYPMVGSIKTFNGTGWDIYADSDQQDCKNPTAIAFDSTGHPYVVCSNTSKVMYYDGTWQTVTGSDELNNPIALAIDSDNVLYVTVQVVNQFDYQLKKFAGASWETLIDSGVSGQILGAAFGPDGYLYLSDRDNHRVSRVDTSSGNLTANYGDEGSGSNQLNQPWGITVDTAGKIYVADSANDRIQVIELGELTRWSSYGGTSDIGQFRWPSGVAFDSQGNYYVVDNGNHRIQKYNGTEWSSYAEEQLTGPYQIAIDSQNYIYIYDSTEGSTTVKKFDSSFNLLQTYTFTGDNLQSIAVDNSDNLYILKGTTGIIWHDNGNLNDDNWHALDNGSQLGEYPNDIAFDHNNILYVITSSAEIKKCDLSNYGSCWETVPNSEDPNLLPGWIVDLAFDSQNNLYLTDNNESQRILRYDGTTWSYFGANGNGTGQFADIGYLNVKSSSQALEIMVTDSDNHTVQLLTYNLDPVSSPTPSPSPAASPTNNNSNSTPSNNDIVSAPACTDSKPTNAPDLFQIAVNSNQATLYFAPVNSTNTDYYIAFGEQSGSFQHGTTTNQANSSGVLSYTISHLQPNTTYYFKVRGQNGCMPGEFSNELKVKTRGAGVANKQNFYKNSSSNSNNYSKPKTKIVKTEQSQVLGSNITIASPEPMPITNPTPTAQDSSPTLTQKSQTSKKHCVFFICWK